MFKKWNKNLKNKTNVFLLMTNVNVSEMEI